MQLALIMQTLSWMQVEKKIQFPFPARMGSFLQG
jgi:hypothetical protein